MLNKTLLTVLMVAVMLALIGWIGYLVFGRDAAIPIETTYGNQRIVYTFDLSTPREPLIEHCTKLGGTFNECGSPCAPEADFCAAVCALTCDISTPDTATSAVLTVGKTEEVQGVSLSLLEILEDSRCPIDVVCIRAGDVRVRLRLAAGSRTETISLKSGESYSFDSATIAIEAVSPSKLAGSEIPSAEYEVTVSVIRQ